MELRLLSANDIRRVLDMPTAIKAMREAFVALSGKLATAPPRLSLDTPGGVALFMPGRLGNRVAAKMVGVNLNNPSRHGVPAIHAAIMTFDSDTGVPTALLDGEWLTTLRTGAAGGLAADLMARPEAGVLAMFGAGVQARSQLAALRCVRELREVRVYTPGASAELLVAEVQGIEARVAATPEEALEGADLVVAATNSSVPVFEGSLVEKGAHVTGVGSFTPEMCEIGPELVVRSRIVVDQLAAALAEAGDIVQPLREGLIDESAIVGELGEVAEGKVKGRATPDEITFFKSVGNAIQDVAVAHLALTRAEEVGLGSMCEL